MHAPLYSPRFGINRLTSHSLSTVAAAVTETRRHQREHIFISAEDNRTAVFSILLGQGNGTLYVIKGNVVALSRCTVKLCICVCVF